MGTVWIVVIDIIVAVVTFFASSSVWEIVRFFSFVVPFTNSMIEQGVIVESNKKQLLFVDGFSSLFFIVLANGLCILGAYFARPSGFIVYFAVLLIMLLFFKPSKDRYSWSAYNILQYVNRHGIIMDMEKFGCADVGVDDIGD